MFRKPLTLGLGLSALAFTTLGLQSSPAQAAERALEEILVTARKRVESIQDVPVAVSTFSEQQIERQTIQEFTDFQAQMPGLYVRTEQHDPSIARVSIRGQQQADSLLTTDASVGVYVDGVSLPRQAGLNSNLFDLERIEVLKGPQGTLYGRNTTGGAVNVIARKPDYEGVHGYLTGSFGNENYTQFSGAINLPLSDTAAARLAVQKTDQDGWGQSRLTGQEYYDQDELFVRGSLMLDPSERVNILLQVDYLDIDEGGAIEKLLQPGGNLTNGLPFTGALSAGTELLGPAASFEDQVNAGFAALQGFADGDLYNTDGDADKFAEATLYGGGLTISVDLTDNIEFKSVTGYRNWETSQLLDLDGTPFVLLHPVLAVDADFFSQELQLSGSTDNLEWVFGGYYSLEEGVDGSQTLAVAAINPTRNITEGEVTNTSIAVFAQGTYSISDSLNLTAGVRWTEEEKELTNKNRLEDAASGTLLACRVPPGNIPLDQCAVDSSDKFSDPSWLLSLDYRISDQLMVYASNSRGFRGGGQNLRADGADVAAAQPFAPETATSYEVGIKGDFADSLLRLNAAAFFVDYEDIQQTIIVPGSAAGSVVTVLTNAAEAEIKGFEVEAWLNPTENFSLFATAGFLDFEYKDFSSFAQDGVTLVDRSDEGTTLPDWQVSLSAQYNVPVGDNELGFQLDYFWTDDYNTDPSSTLPDDVSQDAFGRWNARIDYRMPGDLTISAWGKNLTDEEYITTTTDFTGNLGWTISVVGAPRSFGITVNKKFGGE